MQSSADHFEWVSVGVPDCWCYPRQCHGDADGQKEGSSKSGYFYVYYNDLNTLSASWQKDPNEEGFDICADFDHAADANGFRVGQGDLDILNTYFQVKEPLDGNGIDPNCLDCQ